MKPLVLVDIVGLTRAQIGVETPHLRALAARGACAPMTAVLPAVTCSAQATMLTGRTPAEHGAVGNGWLARDTWEIALWRQSNHLVQGEKIYEAARRMDPSFTCAKLFWWWNMGAAVDWSITPRPYYPADGRKIPAIYSWPTDFGIETERELGTFPFFDFWGPKAGLPSSRWITDAALRTLREKRPTLTLVYLPHLDYDHQRFGPDDPRSRQALREVDGLLGEIVAAADAAGAETMVVSEYGIRPVERPIAINRALREAGLLTARRTPTGEVLDPYGSRAFAVVDHQIAHVYTQDAARAETRALLEALPGVERVLDGAGKREFGLDHPNAGDLIAISDPDAWFSYYYWTDDAHEPDFARTVDIHNKPGYDPCEMFLDPKLAAPKLRVIRRVLQKKLGFRSLIDVIPVDGSLVRGSHGRLPDTPDDGPVFVSSMPFGVCGPEPVDGSVEMTSVFERTLAGLTR
ncbi:MAG: putative AlkP superfamily pyrophosphatase or phosphodiesterase [Chlamydiales bacterium]|jgi:predicted AlkP superfamily pyrophosphatase or phosphodiesterase